MKLSATAARVGGEGVDAWAVHYEAVARRDAGEDVIVLSVGQEMHERTPAPIVDAAIESLRAGRHHYTPVEGEARLREAIARRHGERTGQAVDASRCVVFAGAQNALFAAALCTLDAGDEVVVPEPYYTTYPATFGATGARLVGVETLARDGFGIDPRRMIEALGPATRVVVLNSPNNPTGAVYSRESLAPLVAACAERGVWIVSDEVYADMVAPGSYTSPCALPGGEQVVVTVSSVSKSHRMTGWRMGWAIAPPGLARAMRALCMCMSYGLAPFIQDAALAAVEAGDAMAAEIRAALDTKRSAMRQALSGLPGVSMPPAPGGMFLLLDIRALGVPTLGFARDLLDARGVALLPCDGFGPSGAGLLRISVCESEERLAVAAERIRAHVAAVS